MPRPNLYLVIGLGNPGERYRSSRHNAGFLVADAIARHFAIPVHTSGFGAIYGQGVIASVPAILAKPMEYMNRSGPPVGALLRHFAIPVQRLLVIHDDIDLELGRLKIKDHGGDGGHRGIQSLMETLEEDRFMRLRIGVGRPQADVSVSDHVLGAFAPSEKSTVEQVLSQACNAVKSILCDGTKTAMNIYNIKYH